MLAIKDNSKNLLGRNRGGGGGGDKTKDILTEMD